MKRYLIVYRQEVGLGHNSFDTKEELFENLNEYGITKETLRDVRIFDIHANDISSSIGIEFVKEEVVVVKSVWRLT